MQCARCATPVPDDAKFCHSCGSLVSGPDGATATMGSSDLQQLEDLLRQDTEGEFTIQGRLGRGGMAVVYLATEIHLARQVAIKVLPPELTFGQGVERFKREARTAAALDHPHIIPIYRIASGGKIFWYAMKFLEGRSLEDVLKEKGRLSLEETIQILSQVAQALDYAHKRQVIHRDIKPANVMLDSENRVVVTDFGIAKALTEGTLTASGSVVGTPYYMSPEQGMGKEVTGVADQYSVGVMAYRMLSGQVPFEGDSAIDILHKHCTEPPPPLDVIQSGLPPHVYQAVHRALEKKPEQRFSSVSALVEALKGPTAEASPTEALTVVATGGLSLSSRPTTPVPPSQPVAAAVPERGRRARGRRTVAMVGVGVAAAALAVGALMVWKSAREPAAPTVVSASRQTEAPAQVLTEPQTPDSPAIQPAQTPPMPQPARTGARSVRPATQPAANVRQVLPQPSEPVQQAEPPPPPPSSPAPPAVAPQFAILQLAIEPEADVFVDEVYRGRTRVRSDTLTPGAHLLRVTLEGFRTMDTTLRVTAGQVLRLEVRLERR